MIPAEFFMSVVERIAIPDSPKAQIAMVGRSNVGKSSLINHLTGQKKLARVSSDPGRTQTLNLYDIDDRFYLVDLPGYGYAKTSLEKREGFAEMINDYLRNSPQLRLVFLIIDARLPLTTLDEDMLNWMQDHAIPFTIVMNKMDKVNARDAAALHKSLEELYPGTPRLEHSIDSGKNRNTIWGVIESAVRTPAREINETSF